jgi:hypothetical protein
VYVGTGVVHAWTDADIVQDYTCAGVVQGYAAPEIVLLYMGKVLHSRIRLQD